MEAELGRVMVCRWWWWGNGLGKVRGVRWLGVIIILRGNKKKKLGARAMIRPVALAAVVAQATLAAGCHLSLGELLISSFGLRR